MKKFRLFALIMATIIATQSFVAFAVALPQNSTSKPTSISSTDNKPVNIFEIKATDTPEVYITNLGMPAYVRVPETHLNYPLIVKELSEIKGVKLSKLDQDSGIDTGFLVILGKTKLLINLRPNNIIDVDGVAYGTTTRQYEYLRELGLFYYANAPQIIQWFAYANAANIKKISYSVAPNMPLIDIPEENVKVAAKELREISGKNGETFFSNKKDLDNWPTRLKVVYTFENDVVFNVYTNGAMFFVEGSGMSFSCQYIGDYAPYIARIKELAQKPVGSSSPAPEEIKPIRIK